MTTIPDYKFFEEPKAEPKPKGGFSCTINLPPEMSPRYHEVRLGQRCILSIQEVQQHPGTLSEFSITPANGEEWSVVDAGLLILRSLKAESLSLRAYKHGGVWHFWVNKEGVKEGV